MPTVNIFRSTEVQQFLAFPTYWKCNCGTPKYSATMPMSVSNGGYSTIICQCNHELTVQERETAHNKWRNKQMTEKPVGKKFDQGKYRADLLLDMPRALKAVAQNLTGGLTKGYAESSWLDVPDAERRYTAAHMRHIIDGAIDPEETQFGLKHDVAVATNALFKLELRLRREEGLSKLPGAFEEKYDAPCCVICGEELMEDDTCPNCPGERCE